jgi:uncharacterized cupredoxin-like copper-binding protein
MAIVGAVGAEGTPTAGVASPEASPAASPMASPAADTGVAIEMSEFYFEPSIFTVPADTDITITLTNKGLVGHDFVIASPPVSSPMVDAGETVTFTLNLPAGSYEFICSVEGHADAGMYGRVTAE